MKKSEHYSLKVDLYARFSSPMRELIGCYTHEQLWNAFHPPTNDNNTNSGGNARKKNKGDNGSNKIAKKLIQLAEKAKKTQKRISGTIHKHVMDNFFGLDINEKKAPKLHKGVIIGIDCGGYRSRRMYVRLYSPAVIVKVEIQDLETLMDTKFTTNGVLGKYGACVEIHSSTGTGGESVQFVVGQNVTLRVEEHITFPGKFKKRNRYVFSVKSSR